jgi:pyrroline-5-carboxylate reductase
MGGALLARWLASGLDPASVTIIDPVTKASPGGLVPVAAAPEGQGPRVLVLAVKPQLLEEAAAPLLGRLAPDTLVVSVLAGTRVERLAALFGRPVVRTMPNTPARVGQGATALYGDVSPEDRALAEALMRAAGSVVWLDDEAQFDAVTGVSGSGPAYVFRFIEALAAAAEAAGLPPELAATLARETVTGAAALAAEAGESAAELRVQVTSPKGTTEAGLRALDGAGELTGLLTRTVAAAAERSRELGKA